MYYYAYINIDNGFCYDVTESEVPMDDPSYIEVSGLSSYAEYQKYYSIRKTYENGVWRDTTVEEAEEMYATTMGERITIGSEWLDIVLGNKADIDHTHTGYATTDHTHTEYASSDDLQVLEDVVDTKADSTHTHTEYASASHSHTGYATQTSVDTLSEEIDGKADVVHSHSNYSETTHNHDSEYSDISHNHDEDYSAINHSHANYATTASLSELSTTVSGKANASHTHDDRYYTETEVDTKLATKADSSHTHTGVYDVSGAAASALSSANTYTDEAIDTLSETVATKANTSALTSHTGNTTVHITSTERTNWNAAKTHADSAHAPTTNATQTASGLMSADDKTKLDGITAGANKYTLPSAGTSLGGVKSGGDVTISSGLITVNDDSHNHVISNVDGLQSALDAKAASGHTHGDIYYTETEVDTLLEDKANASHTHTIANVSGLQSTLDGKAATSHGTHVSYSTTAPVMDGSASVGTASTVARSDHKHPTDTSRAAQTSLDSHTGNKSNPHGVTLSQLGLTATATELNALDGITATVTELNYVDGVTSNIQTQLNGKAASSHTHTIANVTNLQTTLDGKASTSHNHSGVYANASHTHTASAVGAVATSDVATVSEVETYLGI